MLGSRRERYRYYNSLVCLAKALEGHYTAIDLRNEASLTGKIEYVDGFMNVEMADVTFYNPRGKQYQFDFFFVNTRNIRYIHIPDGLSPMQLMENELSATSKRPARTSTKKTFKQKRAEKYHQETVQEVSRN